MEWNGMEWRIGAKFGANFGSPSKTPKFGANFGCCFFLEEFDSKFLTATARDKNMVGQLPIKQQKTGSASHSSIDLKGSIPIHDAYQEAMEVCCSPDRPCLALHAAEV